MQHRTLNLDRGEAQRTYAIVLETGDEFVECLSRFANHLQFSASHFTAIGAFSSVVLGYFDWQKKEYRRIPIDEQVEVVALIGDIALSDGRPSLHPHVTVAKSDGSAWGGHLLEGRVRPTLEVVLTETPATLVRRHDPEQVSRSSTSTPEPERRRHRPRHEAEIGNRKWGQSLFRQEAHYGGELEK